MALAMGLEERLDDVGDRLLLDREGVGLVLELLDEGLAGGLVLDVGAHEATAPVLEVEHGGLAVCMDSLMAHMATIEKKNPGVRKPLRPPRTRRRHHRAGSYSAQSRAGQETSQEM